ESVLSPTPWTSRCRGRGPPRTTDRSALRERRPGRPDVSHPPPPAVQSAECEFAGSRNYGHTCREPTAPLQWIVTQRTCGPPPRVTTSTHACVGEGKLAHES